jgi:NADPH-dependent F420 reductase
MADASNARCVAIVGGTGAEGFGLALRLAAAGHAVRIGSRDEARAIAAASDVEAEVEPPMRVEGCTNDRAVAGADVTFVTVPFAGMVEIYRSIAPAMVDGQIVVDCTSPLMTAVGGRAIDAITPWQGSAAGIARSLLPEHVRLVSGLHTAAASSLRTLERIIHADVLICGDDDAKPAVAEVLGSIPHLRAVDCGPLEVSRILEMLTPLMIRLNRRYRTREAGISIVGIDLDGAPPPRPRTTAST